MVGSWSGLRAKENQGNKINEVGVPKRPQQQESSPKSRQSGRDSAVQILRRSRTCVVGHYPSMSNDKGGGRGLKPAH